MFAREMCLLLVARVLHRAELTVCHRLQPPIRAGNKLKKSNYGAIPEFPEYSLVAHTPVVLC